MTLGQYIELLKEVIEARPEARDFEVIFASDDEGNSFQSVTNSPTIGHCSDEYFKEFVAEDNFSEYEDEDPITANCVCIN
jgi:hypothetical protein